MSTQRALIEFINAQQVAGHGRPTALDVNPADVADLQAEIMAAMNSQPAAEYAVKASYQPAGPSGFAPGYCMTFLGIPLYMSSAAPRGTFVLR